MGIEEREEGGRKGIGGGRRGQRGEGEGEGVGHREERGKESCIHKVMAFLYTKAMQFVYPVFLPLVLVVQHLPPIPLLRLCRSFPKVPETLGGQEPPGGQWVQWNHRDQWGLGRRAEGEGGREGG